MGFSVGDIVSRKSHGNDIVFVISKIDGEIVYLEGLNVRLCADASIDDIIVDDNNINDDKDIIDNNINSLKIDRSKYFYIPGRVLHIDGDSNYLERCMKFYECIGVKANGISMDESEFSISVGKLLSEYRPDILVITGHDALCMKNSNKDDLINYQNTSNFISAIKEARKFEKSQDKLIIIAGACQSNYEELIKAGANFASSPKRINIHALDPAIIASSIAFSDKNQSIDLIGLLEKTKYGSGGMGGIITNGTMYVGYPR